jgi:hypothetical protein
MLSSPYRAEIPPRKDKEMEICLVCSSDKDENGLVICSECNEQDNGNACGACGEWKTNLAGEPHNCSEEISTQDRLMKVIEVLKAPESSDEIWWAVGELEALVKDLNSEKENAK